MAQDLTPPWLHLLNALEKEWRTAEILKDRDPDAFLEKHLRATGAWPDGQQRTRKPERPN